MYPICLSTRASTSFLSSKPGWSNGWASFTGCLSQASICSYLYWTKYVSAFENLAKESNTLMLPANTGDVNSMVAQALAIYKKVNNPTEPSITSPNDESCSEKSGQTNQKWSTSMHKHPSNYLHAICYTCCLSLIIKRRAYASTFTSACPPLFLIVLISLIF